MGTTKDVGISHSELGLIKTFQHIRTGYLGYYKRG